MRMEVDGRDLLSCLVMICGFSGSEIPISLP